MVFEPDLDFQPYWLWYFNRIYTGFLNLIETDSYFNPIYTGILNLIETYLLTLFIQLFQTILKLIF